MRHWLHAATRRKRRRPLQLHALTQNDALVLYSNALLPLTWCGAGVLVHPAVVRQRSSPAHSSWLTAGLATHRQSGSATRMSTRQLQTAGESSERCGPAPLQHYSQQAGSVQGTRAASAFNSGAMGSHGGLEETAAAPPTAAHLAHGCGGIEMLERMTPCMPPPPAAVAVCNTATLNPPPC